ncbi:hypothetical protein GOP47_0022149 [Adiantum capillus-veneris]|uniref:Uncharacterized protein n=1 Tax=Adiantum capillus-veneris TaxID=13818 RepID=A0A9D4U970_ADICA|nr:hypothetical protein GOP47_0022149 [Adiantum capillus-veneris]
MYTITQESNTCLDHNLSPSLSAYTHTIPEPTLPRAYGKRREADKIDGKLDKNHKPTMYHINPIHYNDGELDIYGLHNICFVQLDPLRTGDLLPRFLKAALLAALTAEPTP